MRDTVIIGADLAGLTAALRLVHGGAKVILVTKGIEGLQLSQGTIDPPGHSDSGRITQPLAEVGAHITSRPGHPYSHFTPGFIAEFTSWLKEVLGPRLLVGDPRQNVVIPTSLGALCPTSLYQPSMAAGVLAAGKSYVTVGSKRLKDSYPRIIVEDPSRQATADGAPIQVCSLIVDAEIRKGEVDTTGASRARAFNNAAMRECFVAATAPHLREGEVVGLPTVFGLNDLDAWKDIEKRLGHEIFETAMQPPSTPGMRLNQRLTALMKVQAHFITGSYITGVETKDGAVTAINTSTVGRPTRIETKNVVLVDGGFEFGALDMDSYGTITDPVFGLSILSAEGQLFHGDFWGCEQPVFLADLDVDDAMYPLGANKKPIYSNVYAAGGSLAGATR